MAVMKVNSSTPQITSVSRNASAISTGVKVPRVSMPTSERISSTSSTPTGIIIRMRNSCWDGTGSS